MSGNKFRPPAINGSEEVEPNLRIADNRILADRHRPNNHPFGGKISVGTADCAPVSGGYRGTAKPLPL
jgi:hypothetical protein